MKRKKNEEKVRHIKPFYTVTDFAKIFGMSRLGTRNMLYRMKLPFVYVGRRIIFYLSDVRDNNPNLFSSILEANQLNEIIKEQEDLSDQEASNKSNFEVSNGPDWQ